MSTIYSLDERLDGTADLIGDQVPRIRSVPQYTSSAGAEAIELAAYAGLDLDPWQQGVMTDGLGEDEAGEWAADEVGVTVSRQNGKGGIVETRQLAGIYLFNERMIIYSAHEFKTSQEAFRRLLGLINGRDDLAKRVLRVVRGTNEMGIELRTGQRVRFLTRSKGAGRGFTGDCLICDEDMYLADEHMDAAMPTLSARSNVQVWYLGSAGNEGSVVQGRVRRRGVRGEPRLTYLEWSARAKLLGDDADDDPDDPRTWARANPALGIRISLATVRRERQSMSPEGFARERLGIGTYPPEGGEGWTVIPEADWLATLDPDSAAGEALALAVDCTPDHGWTSIAIVADRVGGGTHAELVEHRPGTGWVAARVAELVDRYSPVAIVLDGAGPAGVLLTQLDAAGVEVRQPTAREFAQACGQLPIAMRDRDIVHLDQEPLRAAIAAAHTRPLGEAWAWARRDTTVDLSPLVAVTLAAWAYELLASMPTVF